MQIFHIAKSTRGQWQGRVPREVQPSAPIREAEWPLVWNNQPLNVPIFWRLREDLVQSGHTRSRARIKHAYVNSHADRISTWRPISATSSNIQKSAYGGHFTFNHDVKSSLWYDDWGREQRRCAAHRISKAGLLDINPSFITVWDVNRTLAVREATIRPRCSHSYYTPTPRCCKSFVLEEDAGSLGKAASPNYQNSSQHRPAIGVIHFLNALF